MIYEMVFYLAWKGKLNVSLSREKKELGKKVDLVLSHTLAKCHVTAFKEP